MVEPTTGQLVGQTKLFAAPKTLSITGAAIALVRCMVGPAALYMPHGFAQAGLCGALLIVCLANALFFAGLSRLIVCWRRRAGQRCARDLAQLAGALAGPRARRLTQFCVVSMQAGDCVTYFVFVAETLQAAVRTNCFGLCTIGLAPIILAMVLVEAPFATLRNVDQLQRANAVANALVFAALFVITGYAVNVALDSEQRGDVRLFGTPSGSIVFFGTAVFAFEGTAPIVIPIANAVAEGDRDKIFGVTCGCVVVVAVFYCGYSTIVYLAYGGDVEVIASLSLPSGAWPSAIVNAAYAAVVLLTFPLQLLPASQILFDDDDDDDDDAAADANDHAHDDDESGTPSTTTAARAYATIRNPVHDDGTGDTGTGDAGTGDEASLVVMASATTSASARRRKRRLGDLRRVVFVGVLGALALVGRDSLDHVVALLGALSCAPLALIVGPWMHLALATTRAERAFDTAVIAAGVAVTLVTTALTLASWRDASSR